MDSSSSVSDVLSSNSLYSWIWEKNERTENSHALSHWTLKEVVNGSMSCDYFIFLQSPAFEYSHTVKEPHEWLKQMEKKKINKKPIFNIEHICPVFLISQYKYLFEMPVEIQCNLERGKWPRDTNSIDFPQSYIRSLQLSYQTFF